MLSFLPAPLVGVIALILYALNLVGIALILFILGCGLVIPYRPWRKMLTWLTHEVFSNLWVAINNGIMRLTTRTQWDVQGAPTLDPKGWYLIICNHQSWLDILVLEKVFYRKLPMLKFFMKKELLWMLPVAGVVCWMLGFPFMSRYSKNYLKKHPEKKGKDIETTRRACEKFKDQPIAIINYVEGTRFTAEKQQRQNSPYHYLLRPKAGTFAFAVTALRNHLTGIIDATIIYPDARTNFWRFLCGQVPKIIVRYRVLPIDFRLTDDGGNDAEFTKQFQRWLNEQWQTKDALIGATLQAERA